MRSFMLAHLTGTIVSRIFSDDNCPFPAERFVLPAAKHKQSLVFMASQDKRPRYPCRVEAAAHFKFPKLRATALLGIDRWYLPAASAGLPMP